MAQVEKSIPEMRPAVAPSSHDRSGFNVIGLTLWAPGAISVTAVSRGLTFADDNGLVRGPQLTLQEE